MNTIGFGSKHRERFEQQEAWVGAWLDTYLYPNISMDFKRNEDTETQKRGIDIYITGATTSITVDEKASVEWCNCGLNKYSMELSILAIDESGNAKEVDGWYMSNTSLSTHMGLVFIDSATTVDDRYLTGSGITQATVVFISKERFQKKLDSMGWTKDNLRKKNDIIRREFNIHGNDYYKYVDCGSLYNDNMHFFVQTKPKQKERGINMQFSKQFLIENSDYACIVTPQRITTLNKQ